MTPLIEQAGGIEGMRRMVRTFYDMVFTDMMISFFFRNSDKERLIQKETELLCRAIGDTSIPYTGKPLREAHAAHPIMGGHFERRLQLMRDAMQAHSLPAAVQAAIVEHTEALRPLVTDDAGSECDHDAAQARMERLLR